MTDGINRRDGLKALVASAIAAAAPALFQKAAWAKPVPTDSLHHLARQSGRRFGSCIAAGNPAGATIGNPDYAAVIRRECGLVVMENEMKWQALRPSAGTFDFARADKIAAWAQDQGLALRGHTLLWHRPRWLPAWVNDFDYGARPASAAEAMVAGHIRAVVGRFGAQISSWDVVNEAVNDAADGYIETSISKAMGSVEDALDLAFHTARDVAPEAQLVYNDYMSWEPSYASHRLHVLRLLEGFRKRGTPVDALGVQSHIEMLSLDPATGLGPYAEREWRSFLDEVVAMGYRIIVTEFDVKDKALESDIIARDNKVADYARRYFDVMLSYPQVGDIMAWGMVDCYSWLQNFMPRQDGMEVRGTPYDSAFVAKSLRQGLVTSLSNAVMAA